MNQQAAGGNHNKEFLTATRRVRQMISKKILPAEDIAELHGLFQQATTGDCNDWKFLSNVASQLFDLNSKEKHSTWLSYRGMSQTEAKHRYTEKADILILKYGVIFPDNEIRRTNSVTSVLTCSTYMP